MDRSLRLRTLVLAGILTFCVLYLLPTFVDQDRLPSWFFDNKIQLGLDLQGGAHFVYDIDLNKAVDDKAAELKRDIDDKLEEKKIAHEISTPSVAPGALSVKLTDPAKRGEVESMLKSDYSDLSSRPCTAHEKDEKAICMRISSKFADNIRRTALKQAVKTVEHRINAQGVAEPTVIEKDDQIVVELPGLDQENISHIKELIARTAKLEFKMVVPGSPYMTAVYFHVTGSKEGSETRDPDAVAAGIKAYWDSYGSEKQPDKNQDQFLTASDREEATPVADAKKAGCFNKNLPVKDGKVFCKVEGRKILQRYLEKLAKDNPGNKDLQLPDNAQIGFEEVFPDSSSEKGDKRPFWRTYYLDRTVRLTGTAVSDARVDYDPNTYRPEVIVNFNRYGGRVFGNMTGENVGKKMAIILDDKVESAPVIQTAIRQGVSNITMGGGDPQKQERDARDLVNVLKTGSLPAPLQEQSVAQLGPTLGRDAVAKTQLSFLLGTILVLVIMVTIYRWSGTIAITGIIMNVVMQLTVMAMFRATLTLPGIAALVLTVGMDVDGNILIYERIRDELNLGKSVKGAVDIGFARAFSTILDGHMTTAAAGWVLLQYGTGPIHGFAVLLLVGIGTTLFVNTWVTRLLFDWYISKKKGDLATISI